MTLTEFLLARIAEDEAVAENWPETPHFSGRLHIDTMGHPVWAPRSRMLAECAAKRVAVDWFLNDNPVAMVMGPTIKALAAIYAGHPDYREEWTT